MSATAEASTGPPGLEARLGLLDATMLVAGSMIGSGIFIVSADIARRLPGPGWLLVVWTLAGALTVAAAVSYGRLAAAMPRAGGQYVYLADLYGPLWGFLYGWTLLLVIQTGTIAAVAVAFATYAGQLWPAISPEHALVRLGPGARSKTCSRPPRSARSWRSSGSVSSSGTQPPAPRTRPGRRSRRASRPS